VITQLTGKLVECELTEAVVDVHGVGFAVAIPMSTYDRLSGIGNDVVLHTHLYVREDSMQLFGFATPEERALFRLLITVSGVGPKLALNVLSCLTVKQFCQTIAAGDAKALSRVNGIGKRTAERLVVELREQVSAIEPGAAFGDGAAGTARDREAQDAIAGLEALGFKGPSARRAIEKICRDLPVEKRSAETLIRRALTALNS